MSTTSTAHGITVSLPANWNARIFREVLTPPEVMGPMVHAGNFAIPMTDTGFAGAMMSRVTDGLVGLVYLEYVPDRVIQPGVGLYAPGGFPPPFALADFSPNALQAIRPGQMGIQRFCTIGQRPIVLYAVIGQGPNAPAAVATLNHALKGFSLASSPTASDFVPVPVRSS